MRFLVALGLMATISAQTVVYDNGPIQSAATGGGPGGAAPVSILQTAAPLSGTVFGFGAQQAVPNRLADNFTVNSVMIIDRIRVYGYTTGATAPSCTGVYLAIFDGDPSTGTPNQLLVGAGTQAGAPNLQTAPPAGYSFISNTFTGIYRALDTTPLDATRQVQEVTVQIPQLTLTPGTYWLEFCFNGLNFVPPLTTKDVAVTGDAKQFTNTTLAYAQVFNGPATNFQGLPFQFLSNAPVSTPGDITNLGGGCGTSTFNVAGAPTVGGYFRATLGNVNPAFFGMIVVGFSDPNSPLIVCGCTSRASLDILNIVTAPNLSLELQIPLQANLVGTTLYLQGAQLDLLPVGGLPCNLGVQFEMTDGYRFRVNSN